MDKKWLLKPKFVPLAYTVMISVYLLPAITILGFPFMASIVGSLLNETLLDDALSPEGLAILVSLFIFFSLPGVLSYWSGMRELEKPLGYGK